LLVDRPFAAEFPAKTKPKGGQKQNSQRNP